MDSGSKKIGIVCDNYKLREFRRLLSRAGFDQLQETSFGPGLSIITIQEVPTDRVKEIKKICQKVNIDVHLSN